MGEQEFGALFRDYHPVMVAAAYNRLSDLSDAEDAAAEVFAQAWRRRNDTPNALTIAWLYATLRNVVGSQYRGRERHQRRVERWRWESRPGESGAVTDDSLDVRSAVGRLDQSDRELLWMAYWEDLTHDEISQILNCSHAALRVRLHRARKKLAAILTPSPAQRTTSSPVLEGS